VSLKKYKSQGKGGEVIVNSKEENPKTFVWISSKNSASAPTATFWSFQSRKIVPLAATIRRAVIGRQFYRIIKQKFLYRPGISYTVQLE
jgi:hypothetical protein